MDILERINKDMNARPSEVTAWRATMHDARAEIERLQELRKLVQDYYDDYMQDEADDPAMCINDEQHRLAAAIRDALNELKSGAC